VLDARPHKRYALLFNDVLLLVRPKVKTFKAIRAIPVRKALYQFGEDILQVLFDYNQLARLRFPLAVRQMWYKTLKGMQAQGKRWPTDIRMSTKAKSGSGTGSSGSASELEEMRRKQRKLLMLVDKYEQLSSLHLTAMAKNDGVVSDLQKRVARLEKQIKVLGGETVVDFVALDAEKEKLLLENMALREGLSQVESKVKHHSRGSSVDEADEPSSEGKRSVVKSSTVSVSSHASSSEDDDNRKSIMYSLATPAKSESTFDDFRLGKAVQTKAGDSTTLDDILTPDVVEAAVVASRSHSSASHEDDESSSFVEP